MVIGMYRGSGAMRRSSCNINIVWSVILLCRSASCSVAVGAGWPVLSS